MNPRSPSTPWILLAIVTILAVSGLLTAGPLNPPTGPISAGGKTTQEIYDAVTNISNNIGGSGRGPAVPGTNYTGGTFTLATSPTPITGPILGLRQNLSTAFGVVGGGYTAGNPAFGSFTVVRELGSGSATTFKVATSVQVVSSATITVPSAGGNTVYVLTTAYIMALRQYSIQRADGTFASIEEMDLIANQFRVTDPTGATWNYSYLTHAGGV